MRTTHVSRQRACHWRVIAASEMARFDVYLHPEPVLRKKTPYLLDVQNNHINSIATRIVVPLRLAEHFPLRMRDLNPEFEVGGKALVLDTTALGAIPVNELKRPVANLGARSAEVVAALDCLFGAY